MSNEELMDQLYKHTVETQTEKLLAENRRLTSINQNGKATILVVGDELVEAVANAATQKLYNYENAEDRGTLIKLPCKAGDTVYRIDKGKVKRFNVTLIEICDGNIYLVHSCREEAEIINACKIGKTVFLTREAAEKALNKGGQ